MIEARGLTKFYGELAAVSDLSFTVRPGIVTGFLGPNGAGKSTTMRLIHRELSDGKLTRTAGSASDRGSAAAARAEWRQSACAR
jgi:ABC-type multidrug transport system ATPase subunit